jgi:hypothetical protein
LEVLHYANTALFAINRRKDSEVETADLVAGQWKLPSVFLFFSFLFQEIQLDISLKVKDHLDGP